MKTVNLGDKYTHRVTLRLNDGQFDFLVRVSSMLGVTPSDYLRMSVNAGMMATEETVNDTIKEMVGSNENDKTSSNHKL